MEARQVKKMSIAGVGEGHLSFIVEADRPAIICQPDAVMMC
jgi:hypothetical protein